MDNLMFRYILLGVIQGLTEFLPVSSSGHIAITQGILRISVDAVALSVVLHLGTSLALLIFFFKDIMVTLRNPRLLLLILMVTVITGIVGILGQDFFESLFSAPPFIALGLIITGIILIISRKYTSGKRAALNIRDALLLGLAQAVAIIPGISRTGITISTLLFRKIDKETSFRFSFLAAIPAVWGATLLKLKDIKSICRLEFINLAAGFIFSLGIGLISLWLLRKVLFKAKLHYFGYYCMVAAIVIFLIK